MIEKKHKAVIAGFLVALTISAAVFNILRHNSSVLPALAASISEMNARIDEKKGNIGDLENRIAVYENQIRQARGEVSSLKNQLEILNAEIEKSDIDIQISEQQIQKTSLEIQKITFSIIEKEKGIELQKERLSEFLRQMYEKDQVSDFEIMLSHNSFSDFYNYYRNLEELQAQIHVALKEIEALKHDLEMQKKTLEEKKEREMELKQELEVKKAELLARSQQKEQLISETRQSESRFQTYVAQLKREQQDLENEISSLEKMVREELERRKEEERFNDFGPARLQWPTDGRYITATFHDPDYPYRHIFEHPAIDIRASQGTSLKAAEAGYVARAHNGGREGYSYIMLIHSDGISTVYGHVSAMYVSADQYVNKGEVIGLTGGAPGTSGAGRFTTGPHLHFEVRKNGIPINPLEYLP